MPELETILIEIEDVYVAILLQKQSSSFSVLKFLYPFFQCWQIPLPTCRGSRAWHTKGLDLHRS